MPYYNENGDEVQGVLTPEEVQQQLADKDAEIQRTQEELQATHQEELQTIQQQLADKEAEMEKLEDKNKNADRTFGAFKRQSTEMIELRKQIEDLKGGLVGQIEKINQVLSEKTIDEAVLRVSGGDKVLSDKVKFFYKSFSGVPKDDKELQTRLENALVLATGGKSNVMNGQVYSGAGGSSVPENVGSAGKWTDEQKQFAAMFGITDADIAKYSGKMPRYPGDGLKNSEWLNR
jgi:alanyl-tRNA synthetase